MKALRKPADPAKSAKDYLAATLPDLLDINGLTVGLVVPEDWTLKSPPHVSVFDDSGPGRWPVATRPVLRVTVWAKGRTLAREIAGSCAGVLLAHKIPGIANVREPSSILDARDPKNGGLMASFTVRTSVRTLPI